MSFYTVVQTPSTREVMLHQYLLPASYYLQDSANAPLFPTERIHLSLCTFSMQYSVLRRTNYSNSVNYATDLMDSDRKKQAVEIWGASSMAEPKQTLTEKATITSLSFTPDPFPQAKRQHTSASMQTIVCKNLILSVFAGLWEEN